MYNKKTVNIIISFLCLFDEWPIVSRPRFSQLEVQCSHFIQHIYLEVIVLLQQVSRSLWKCMPVRHFFVKFVEIRVHRVVVDAVIAVVVQHGIWRCNNVTDHRYHEQKHLQLLQKRILI